MEVRVRVEFYTGKKKKAIWNRMTYFLILSIGIIEKNGLP